MTVKELGEALRCVPVNMEVTMADEISVVFAEVLGGAFVSAGSSFVFLCLVKDEGLHPGHWPNDSTPPPICHHLICAGAIEFRVESRLLKSPFGSTSRKDRAPFGRFGAGALLSIR